MGNNADLARTVYALFNKGDLEAAADHASPSMRTELLTMGQTFDGRDGFMMFMQGFKGAFPDIEITVDTQVEDGSHIVSECTWHGTNTGPLPSPGGEIPPTGKPVTGARFCEVWTIKGGKIERLVNYQDSSTWLRQLGLVP